jgi:hypothetical protein
MKVMTAAEIERAYGMSARELDQLSADAENGVLHGAPRGPVVVGRPLKFGEDMRQVGFKEPESVVAAIDARAQQLGMKRSDYLRHLVDADLKAAGIA